MAVSIHCLSYVVLFSIDTLKKLFFSLKCLFLSLYLCADTNLGMTGNLCIIQMK